MQTAYLMHDSKSSVTFVAVAIPQASGYLNHAVGELGLSAGQAVPMPRLNASTVRCLRCFMSAVNALLMRAFIASRNIVM